MPTMLQRAVVTPYSTEPVFSNEWLMFPEEAGGVSQPQSTYRACSRAWVYIRKNYFHRTF